MHAEHDENWVKLIAFAGYNYRLATSNTGAHADTVMYLYTSDGTTLTDWNDDDPDNWPASRLEWQPLLSGVYCVKVSQWDEYAYGCTTEHGLSINSDLMLTDRTYMPIVLNNK